MMTKMETCLYIGKDEINCYFELVTGDIFGFPIKDCKRVD